MGTIHQDAREDSKSCTGTPHPETSVVSHIELNKQAEKAHISPKIKVL